MSDRVNLSTYPCRYSDWSLYEWPSPESIAQECGWQLPLKVMFDDKNLLLRFLTELEDECGESPAEIWTITYAPTGCYIVHPSWAELADWLEKL